MPFIAAAPDPVKWTDKWTTIGTIAAVIVALLIAIVSTGRDIRIRRLDREAAETRLREEREAADGRLAKETAEYERRLKEERELIERQRRADRSVDLLIRVADAYANASHSQGVFATLADDPTARDRTRARILLAALPDDIAVLMRDRVQAPESIATDGSARRKLAHLNEFQRQGGRPSLSDAALMAYEMTMDMRRLTSGNTETMINGRFWWDPANDDS